MAQTATASTLLGKARFNPTALIAAAGGVFLFLIYLKIAWVSDDGYIIFRSLDQLFAGNGPRWNPHNRVQLYTSPLWFWLLAAFRVFSPDLFINAIVASGLFFVGTMLVTGRLLNNSLKWLATWALLVSSTGFFDFTSAGMETGLCYFLISIYVLLYHRLFVAEAVPAQTKSRLRKLLVCFGLLLTCRHDILTLTLVPTLYAVWAFRKSLTLRQWLLTVVVAMAPIVIWTAISLIYYGIPVPNTAFAKLNTGIPKSELWRSGFDYLGQSFKLDAITPIIVLAALLVLIVTSRMHVVALVAGVLINIAYVVSVGGDFMVGRFFSFAYILVILVIMLYVVDSRVHAALILAAAVGYSIFYHHTPINSPLVYSNKVQGATGAIDERGHYEEASLLKYLKRDTEYFPDHRSARQGYELRKEPAAVLERGQLGYFSYWTGIDKIVVDPFALSDPLLARLPVDRSRPWRVGHFQRRFPEGFIDGLVNEANLITDPGLNELNKRLNIITQRRDLFSAERLKTIVAMNLGRYDHLIPEDYAERPRPATPR